MRKFVNHENPENTTQHKMDKATLYKHSTMNYEGQRKLRLRWKTWVWKKQKQQL